MSQRLMSSKFYMKSITSFQIIYNFAHLFLSAQKETVLQNTLKMKGSAAETSSNKRIVHTEEIVEHSLSVRTGKMGVLLCYIFVYYFNVLFESCKPGFLSLVNLGGGGAEGPLHKTLKHASPRL